jgi:hypothetical protein
MQPAASASRDVVILVVEDNPDVLEATAYLIEAASAIQCCQRQRAWMRYP